MTPFRGRRSISLHDPSIPRTDTLSRRLVHLLTLPFSLSSCMTCFIQPLCIIYLVVHIVSYDSQLTLTICSASISFPIPLLFLGINSRLIFLVGLVSSVCYFAAPESSRPLKGLCVWCADVFVHIEKSGGCCFSFFLKKPVRHLVQSGLRFHSPMHPRASFRICIILDTRLALFIWRIFFFFPALISSPPFSRRFLVGLLLTNWALVLLNRSNDFHISLSFSLYSFCAAF